MTPRPAQLLLALAASTRAQISDRYSNIGLGVCRGNGGTEDYVNAKYVEGVHSEASCEAECDEDADCKGFAWGDAQTRCFIYGPGVAGHCHLDSANVGDVAFAELQDTDEKCSAAGSCSDASVTCGANCLGMQAVCENLDATWTSMGAAWVGPDDPWQIGHSSSTTHIHATNGNADYTCYDLDLDDHAATCTNEINAHSGILECADEWTSPTDGGTCGETQRGCPGAPCNPDDTVSWCCNKGSVDCDHWHYCACERDFEAADTYAEADCDVAGGCVFTAAPRMERVVVPHPPSTLPHGADGVYMAGMGGACRGTDDDGAEVGANSKYSNNCDIDGKRKACGEEGQEACSMTQEECEAGCAAENAVEFGRCNAYHHGAWCSIFGPTMHEGLGIDDDDPCWFANPYDATIVTGTNTNAGYMCWKVCGIDRGFDQGPCITIESDAASAKSVDFAFAALAAGLLL